MGKDEIRYRNVEDGDGNVLSTFPVLSAYGPDNKYEMLLLYQYRTEMGPDYVVLGKFKEGSYPTTQDFSYLAWVHSLYRLLHEEAKSESYQDFLKQLSKVKESSEMDKIMFTQEGYDLINGKFFFQEDGQIQRTVEMDAKKFPNDILFGKDYRPTNEAGKMSLIDLFAPWDKYDDEYFLNRSDLNTLIPGDSALLYAVINKDRLYDYIRNRHGKWGRAHNIDEQKKTPDEVASYSLQLLDVVTNFQTEEILMREADKQTEYTDNKNK